MSPQCFHCDGELVPEARFCHRCGTPTFSAYRTRPGSGVDPAERTRIKEEVTSAAQVPTTTRMTQTVLAPRAAQRAAAPAPVWLRILRMRLWRRWYLWVGIGGLAALALVPRILDHFVVEAGEGTEVYHIYTRLSTRCPGDSRADLSRLVERVRGASGGLLSEIETARLFEYAARSLDGRAASCSRIADALARPDRFDRLLR